MNHKRILPKRLLIVDDEPSMRAALRASLNDQYTILTAINGEEALKICTTCAEDRAIDAILTDIKMPGMSGIDLFQRIKQQWPDIPVIIMSAFGTVEGAVEAMRSGAFDYLVKPFSEKALCSVVRKALCRHKPDPNQALPKRNSIIPGGKRIITQDPAMLKMLKMAEVVAASQATVLIQAESGTGKELLARFIHDHSPRAHRPFVAINCAAVPETLLESELFGYEKGAFTGAVSKKPGRFELAQSGTLLLDEVSEMQMPLQAKLLRVLQEREVDLLGSQAPMPIDIRIIATTNRPLLEEVRGGRFREDLYYRLNVFPLQIPPLRDRRGDIPLLVAQFIGEGKANHFTSERLIDPKALAVLMGMDWRGNIRELENIVERALLLSGREEITRDHLLFPESPIKQEEKKSGGPTTVWEAERHLILETLSQVAGNRTHAARILGISIRTLRNKLREYHQLDPDCEEIGLRENNRNLIQEG